jgi:hypothetical protein
VFILDSLLVGGLRFVLDKVAAVADQELNDPERWRAELLDLQMRFEEGRIDQEAFAERERAILDRLRALHPGGVGVVAGAGEIATVDVEIGETTEGDEEERG